MPDTANIINADKHRAAQDLLNWMDREFPGSKEKILKTVGSPGMGQAETTTANAPWYSKIIEAAGQVGNAYYQSKIQKETADIQISRAQQGLPPLDLSKYGPAPITTEVAVKMSPQTKTMLWVGGGLLAAIILLPLLTGKRR